MPSDAPLSLRLLVDHFIASKPGSAATASSTALDHLVGQGDVNALLGTVGIAPEGRDRFVRNVLELIENDINAPIEHSLVRLTWVMPALHQREPTERATDARCMRGMNLFEQLSGVAVLQRNFDVQIPLLGLSNTLPPSARGMLEPINYLGLCNAITHAVIQMQNAQLDDMTPLHRFKALAEVAATRCNFDEMDEDFGTLDNLRERVASMDVLVRKLGLGQPRDPGREPDQPPRSGRRRKPPKPRRDPP